MSPRQSLVHVLQAIPGWVYPLATLALGLTGGKYLSADERQTVIEQHDIAQDKRLDRMEAVMEVIALQACEDSTQARRLNAYERYRIRCAELGARR